LALTLSGIWFDWNKVIRNNTHGVTIDGKHLNSFSPSVNQSKSVDFASSKFEIGDPSVISTRLVGGND